MLRTQPSAAWTRRHLPRSAAHGYVLAQTGDGGRDPLVGGRERHPDVLGARGAVEVAGGGQDARARPARRRSPSRARRGSSRDRATPRNGRSGSRLPRRRHAASPAGLRSARAARRRARRRPAPRPWRAAGDRASAGRGSCGRRAARPDHRAVAGDERAAVAGQVGPLRQRVHGQDAVGRAAADVGVEHGDRLGVPGALEVALVGDQQRAPLAAPVHHLAQVLDREHPAGRVGRRVEPEQRGPLRAERRSGSRWRSRGRRPGPRRPRRSDRRARGSTTRSSAPSPRWEGIEAISSLEPITGSTWSSPSPLTPWRRASQSRQACRVSSRPTVSG